MATVQIKIKTIGDTDVNIDQIKKSGTAEVTNGSIQVDKNGCFTANSSKDDFAGQEMFTFTSDGLNFSSDGTLVNADGHSAVLVDEENGKEFVWGVVPTSKAYTVQMSIVLTALKLTALTFVGDPIAGQFPTKIVVDGEEYVNDEVDITLPISGTKREVVVQFTEWNRANYSAVLTKVAIMADEITLGNSDIKTLESQSQSTSQPTDIYYGSVPSSGSVNIYDKNGDFYDHVRNGVLPNSNVPVELFVNGKKVQGHISTDSHYDVNGRTFSLDFENKLSLYEKVMYEGYAYTDETKTLYEMFETFCEKVGLIDATNKDKKMATMLGKQIVYGTPSKLGTVADYFRAITVPYPYIERGTVRQTLDKFCQLTQLNLIENDNGDLVFVQSRPVRAGNEQVLVIPTHCQMSAIDTDIVIDNIIDKAVVPQKTATVESKYSNAIGTITITETVSVPAPRAIWTTTSEKKVYTEDNLGNKRLYKFYGYVSTSDVKYYRGGFTIKIDNCIVDTAHNTSVKFRLYYMLRKGIASCSESIMFYDDENYPNFPIGGDVRPFLNINYSGIEEYSNLQLDSPLPDYLAGSTALVNSFSVKDNYSNLATDDVVKISSDMVNETDYLSANFQYISDNTYYISFTVLGGKRFVRMYGGAYQNQTLPVTFYGSPYGNFWFPHTSTDVETGLQEYIPIKLEVTFCGYIKTITFNDVDTSADESDEHTVSIGGNEMLQTATTLVVDGTSTDLATQISKNITTDYKNGIETMRLTVCCADYKDTYGVVRKNWSKGEIFEVGDIVRVDKDNNGTPAVTYKNGNAKLWKVTGRTFRNEGVPLVDLELQEII